MTNLTKKIVREPLLHFLLLGVVIFVAYTLVSEALQRRARQNCDHARST